MHKSHNKHPIFESKFEFGKYKGIPITVVIERDPRYISWCLENITGFKLSKSLAAHHQQVINRIDRKLNESRYSI